MSAGSLIKFFACFTKVPVYAEDVRDQIIELGIQDIIIFRPIDVDPETLKGMYFRYRTSAAPYSEHQNVSVIFYNSRVSPDMQNFICIKELMHVFDEKIHAAVTTATDLDAHLSYLFKEERGDPVEPNLSGILDRAAEWLAIAVMFPHDVRDDFMAALDGDGLNETQLATELGIPINYVSEVISDQWESFRKMLLVL